MTDKRHPTFEVLASGNVRFFVASIGRNVEAIREYEEAIELDPHALKGPDLRAELSWRDRDYEDAISRELEILEVDPNFLPALGILASSYRSAGQLEKALETAEKMIALRNGDTMSLLFKAIVLVDLGRRDEAKFLLDGVAIEQSRWTAVYYAALGDTERALDLIRNQAAQNYYRAGLTSSPHWDPLHEDDRYWRLLEELNYPKLPPGHPNYDQQQAWLARKAESEQNVGSRL